MIDESDRQKIVNLCISKKYFSMDEAINCAMPTRTIFIIANERKKKSGGTGRYYTVFPTFKDFMIRRENFPHCHEILLDHRNNKSKPEGRLVFDFDIKEKD